ncbi:MAG: Gfo/Idh/MocA family oxidoreductase [Candidatus Sumerlaeota bacterium]|nr:Gfo/Idh/MocA family oxidoreductase [Candidatus Sumerlaeota bacterium]
MVEPVSIALAGVGGYGEKYLGWLWDKGDSSKARLVAGIDPNPVRCKRLHEFKERGVPIHASYEEFLANGSAELVVIAAPIHYHCALTCAALERGSHALCEKPLGATIQEARRMMEARDRAGKSVAIGYQWSYSEAIQALKHDIMSGLFGAPKRLKTLALWPRDEAYYTRNRWAGAKRDSRGAWILDSPINNATAHYLHNCLYVLGDGVDTSARPARVVAELYRANAIENFDTGAARIWTDQGVEILYIATHATKEKLGPVLEYEFEEATIVKEGEKGEEILARFHDGRVKSYGGANANDARKLWAAVEAARGAGDAIVCGPEAAGAQTLCVNGMQESVPAIVEFPRSLVRVEGEPGKRRTWVEGLGKCLTQCYDEWKLPSETGAKWGRLGKEIDLTNYRNYPRGAER